MFVSSSSAYIPKYFRIHKSRGQSIILPPSSLENRGQLFPYQHEVTGQHLLSTGLSDIRFPLEREWE